MEVLVRSRTNNDIWLSTEPGNNFGKLPIQRSYPGVTTFYESKGPFN
jgi:hypothetical protein